MSENVSSEVLFHFTNSMDALKGILKNGFFPRSCPEYTLDPADRKAAARRNPPLQAIPMVCFCDLPLSLIRKHLKKYGKFGIGLDKKWGLKHRVSPVSYTHAKSQTRQPILRLIGSAEESNDESAAHDLKVLAAYTKPFAGPEWRNNCVRQMVRFYDEREWRYVPEPLLLNWKDYLDQRAKTELHQRFERQYALQIHPDDIQYLILPYEKDEKQILELHDYLMGLYERRYGRKKAVLVSTAIMTDDCIKKDV